MVKLWWCLGVGDNIGSDDDGDDDNVDGGGGDIGYKRGYGIFIRISM